MKSRKGTFSFKGLNEKQRESVYLSKNLSTISKLKTFWGKVKIKKKKKYIDIPAI